PSPAPPPAALTVEPAPSGLPLPSSVIAAFEAEPTPPPVADVAPEPARESRLRTLISSRLPDDWARRLWIGAGAALAVVIVLVMPGVSPWLRGPSTGSFSIDTRPAGAAVTIDGTPRGVTPLVLQLTAGDHVVEVITESDRRKIPVTIRAGSELSQFLEMTGGAAGATATANELRIRTEPIGAAVTVDGRYVGQSPVSVSDLTAGPHTVVMKHDAGTVTEQVLIEAGKTASLFVPLSVQPSAGVGAAGWIAIVGASADVQLFENGRLLGSNRIDRIMLPVGRHDLEIVNESLGFQERRTVQVTPGQVSSIRVKWPTGGLSINAVPWAQAFIDGSPVGETPIANMQVPIGPHEITFRHPQLGERRASVTVTARETAKVGIDLRAQP
ncbi:MAG TPA: PEGA domain-containing protein, partial [Vicinamibacterales bacterium]|nr:PEGA domain-containing protein [Vicinamibacterales bacterium]